MTKAIKASEKKEKKMDRPYVAVTLKIDQERTRSTYATADEAYQHAADKIGVISRTEGKVLQFAICKVVEIVEATSPIIGRRAPKNGDGSPTTTLARLHPMCRCTSKPISSNK